MIKTFKEFKSVSGYAFSNSIVNLYADLEKMLSGNIDDIVFPNDDYNYLEVYKLSLLLEQYLKNTYSNQVDSATFKIDGEPDEVVNALVHDNGEAINANISLYKLPDDKILVVHVKDAYGQQIGGFMTINTYKDAYFNFSSIYATSHHLSTSVISNSQGEVANTRGVIYGYADWKVGALVEEGTHDIYSYSGYDIHLRPDRNSEFYDTSSLLNNTYSYNELVFERSEMIPRYVVIFASMDASLKERAYQAAYDWNIPIVEVQR